MYCWTNFSACTYSTILSGKLVLTEEPIAWIRCDFPRPVCPYRKSGLKEVPPGLPATAKPAERANRLQSPSMKLSNEYFGFNCGSIFTFFKPGITKGFRMDVLILTGMGTAWFLNSPLLLVGMLMV